MLRAIRKQVRIGADDDGRRMSLEQFDRAIATEGFVYELGNGVIEVSEVPDPKHLAQVQELRKQFFRYDEQHPDVVHSIASSNECKLLIASIRSERHPDLSIYLGPPPEVDVWSLWVPQIVIEVVSQRSARRDYDDKPAEYLEFGVDEYWIVDASKDQMTVLTRWRGLWKKKIVKPAQPKHTTHHLPGFALDLRKVLAAGQ